MGAIHFSLDPNIVRALRQRLPLDVFIETGTFRGDTLKAFHDEFRAMYSAELSGEYYAAAHSRFGDSAHIELFHGESPKMIETWRDRWEGESCLYWLDAHWCDATATGGQQAQCPLLEELAAIGSLNERSVILIDDARLFVCAPPGKHDISQWPQLESILSHLRSLSADHQLMLINDTLVFVPSSVTDLMQVFAAEHNSNLLTLADKARNYDDLLEQLIAKEAALQEITSDAAAKESVIQGLRTALEAYRAADRP